MLKKWVNRFFLISALSFGIFLSSCEKDPEVIVETITVVDTLIVVDTLTVVDTVVNTVIDTVFQSIPDTATTFILIRHAETTGSSGNPNLSAVGQARATELRRILENIELNAVYSTNFNRTRQTAQPTADSKTLDVEIYDAFALNPFADEVLANHHSGIVLVVGHSNTTPSLLNVLLGSNSYSNLPETEYDNLYIVTVFEKGRAEVVHLKYGE